MKTMLNFLYGKKIQTRRKLKQEITIETKKIENMFRRGWFRLLKDRFF